MKTKKNPVPGKKQLNINPNTVLSSYIMDEGDDDKKPYYYRIKDAKRDEYVILTRVNSHSEADITFTNRLSGNTVGAGLTKHLVKEFKQLQIHSKQKVAVDVSNNTEHPDLILLFGKNAPVASDDKPLISFDPSHKSHTDKKAFDTHFVEI